ncbi:YceI family protein [Corynebacterium sp. 320]|uniref:YceI family protein n=1 Tax=Corynebacterium TaxID=1716 RepID=UPI00125CC6FE|nr:MULTISPECIES: YceI family protein [Corynebacterium]KAB1502768.1 YceI family protein [Corynebacterium sp. 320]KAB1550491.1 YceI family protein [Corynebacterium sp. 319]KAB1554778.1 YceI family protein [Corynebacterium sp. 321]KAB3526431.1 YceI family protein [Corynebacterium sp. 250]KAB3539750.1 YceI family protein [Corynebacterium sp. 366]
MSTLNAYSGTYTIDPTHSEIGFTARHAMITKVRGAFNTFEGTATTGENLDGASITVTINADSIDTRNADRDAHVKGADFFDVEQFPHITFTSTDITADGETLIVTGDLTIKDTTKSVTINFDFEGAATDAFGQDRVGFSGSTTINRREYGLEWQTKLDNGGVMVSDKITLNFDISAIKQS